MTDVKVTILPGGLRRLQDDILEPWLIARLEKGRGVSVREVNVDTGSLRSSIQTRISKTDGRLVGYIEALNDYALWQETEPGDIIPGVGTRIRSGGKPYLRPGLYEAIRPYLR